MNLDAMRRLEVDPPEITIPLHMLPPGTTISITIVIGGTDAT